MSFIELSLEQFASFLLHELLVQALLRHLHLLVQLLQPVKFEKITDLNKIWTSYSRFLDKKYTEIVKKILNYIGTKSSKDQPQAKI